MELNVYNSFLVKQFALQLHFSIEYFYFVTFDSIDNIFNWNFPLRKMNSI